MYKAIIILETFHSFCKFKCAPHIQYTQHKSQALRRRRRKGNNEDTKKSNQLQHHVYGNVDYVKPLNEMSLNESAILKPVSLS